MEHVQCFAEIINPPPEVIYRESVRRDGINIRVKCCMFCVNDENCPLLLNPVVSVNPIDAQIKYNLNSGVRKISFDKCYREWEINFWPEELSSRINNSRFVLQISFTPNVKLESRPFFVKSKPKSYRSQQELRVLNEKMFKTHAFNFMKSWVTSEEGKCFVRSILVEEVHSILRKRANYLRSKQLNNQHMRKKQHIETRESKNKEIYVQEKVKAEVESKFEVKDKVKDEVKDEVGIYKPMFNFEEPKLEKKIESRMNSVCFDFGLPSSRPQYQTFFDINDNEFEKGKIFSFYIE